MLGGLGQRQTERQTERETERETERQTDRDSQRERESERERDRDADETARERERERDRQIERERERHGEAENSPWFPAVGCVDKGLGFLGVGPFIVRAVPQTGCSRKLFRRTSCLVQSLPDRKPWRRPFLEGFQRDLPVSQKASFRTGFCSLQEAFQKSLFQD